MTAALMRDGLTEAFERVDGCDRHGERAGGNQIGQSLEGVRPGV
jgi:hypothetical protein